ncbi:MAG: hypothetical protein WA431_16060, partial [Candidatus Cybelea sp.]
LQLARVPQMGPSAESQGERVEAYLKKVRRGVELETWHESREGPTRRRGGILHCESEAEVCGTVFKIAP